MINEYITKEIRTYNGIKTVYSINGVGKMNNKCKENETKHHFTPHTRINSKWIKDLSIKLKAIQLLE